MALFENHQGMNWAAVSAIGPKRYDCAFCGSHTGPHMGFYAQPPGRYVFICTFCSRPTYFEGSAQFPMPPLGDEVQGLPPTVRAAYEECRSAASAGAFTAATLMLRTLISHVAVEKGATVGDTFNQHVQHLIAKAYVSKDAEAWLSRIRTDGNDAAHKLVLATKEDANLLLAFAAGLLKHVYEFNAKLAAVTPKPPQP